MPRPDIAGLRWAPPEQWHVTLRFLGDFDDVGVVEEAVDGVTRRCAEPVIARAGPATGRFGHRILHLPVDGLAPLAAGVAAATAGFGQPPEDRAFAGHITLARVRERARVNLRALEGTPLAAEWSVEELTVVESRLSSAGARYAVGARAPLAPC